MKKAVLAGGLAIALAACGGEKTAPAAEETQAPEPAAPAPAEILDAVIAGDHRSEEERARDVFRHPKETLLFFGIEPDMTVVEAYPGGGWYTQVIAPYLKAGGGKLYAAGYDPASDSERVQAALASFRETYVEQPELYGDVEMTVLGGAAPIAPEGSADAVVTFRNVHSWRDPGEAELVFGSFHDALKPGGVLGIVEHRADGAAEELPKEGSSGYMYTDDVVAIAEAAGFVLDRSAEINANPADTKNHPFGVWTLPPVGRSSEIRGNEDPDFDRARYDAIGESDRMTLRFIKPAVVEEALYE